MVTRMSSLSLMTTKEMAAAIGVSTRTVARMVEAGTLEPAAQAPGTRGAYLFDPAEVGKLQEAARD